MSCPGQLGAAASGNPPLHLQLKVTSPGIALKVLPASQSAMLAGACAICPGQRLHSLPQGHLARPHQGAAAPVIHTKDQRLALGQ